MGGTAGRHVALGRGSRDGTGTREGMGNRGRGYGWGQASSAAAPPSHLTVPTRASPAMHPLCPSCTLPMAASPRAVPAPGFRYFRLRRHWDRAPQGHTELTQPPLTIPRPAGTTLRHADAPARRPACPLAAACRAEHRRLSPVCRRDRADPLLKHQRCSKFFNLPNRSISNYHVSHS